MHIIIIIIIIKRNRQSKAGRERFTPNQTKDLSPTPQLLMDLMYQYDIKRERL